MTLNSKAFVEMELLLLNIDKSPSLGEVQNRELDLGD